MFHLNNSRDRRTGPKEKMITIETTSRAPIDEYDTPVYGSLELCTEKLTPNDREPVRDHKQDHNLEN
jgi:hypothetical protein